MSPSAVPHAAVKSASICVNLWLHLQFRAHRRLDALNGNSTATTDEHG
jgi:hypothetical protein